MKQYKLTITKGEDGYNIVENNDLPDIEVIGMLSQLLFKWNALILQDTQDANKKSKEDS